METWNERVWESERKTEVILGNIKNEKQVEMIEKQTKKKSNKKDTSLKIDKKDKK
jgi:hypothetical protein